MDNTNGNVIDLFEQTGAYLHGHFRLTSGLHSSEYVQCARVLQHPKFAEGMGKLLAAKFTALAAGTQIAVVASPAIGGLIIGHEVARSLGARFVFTERDTTAKMTLRRGFAVEPSEIAVVVEDVITTGGSLRETYEVLHTGGAKVIAAGSIIDRSGGRADLGIKRVTLATLQVTTWAPELCPLCREGQPIVKPGSRPS